MKGMILAVGCLGLPPPQITHVLERTKKTLPGASVTQQALGASHCPSLKKVTGSLNLFWNQQNPQCHCQKYCCWSKNKETQSLGQSDRENWTVETMKFLVLSAELLEWLVCYIPFTDNQKGYSCCTTTEQNCNSFTFSSKRNVPLWLLSPSNMSFYSTLTVHLKWKS